MNTPELLVVALHQALFIISGFAFHHSFLTSYSSLSLENNMALAETCSFYTTLRLLNAGWSSNAYQPNICGCRLPPLYTLCKPFVAIERSPTLNRLGKWENIIVCNKWALPSTQQNKQVRKATHLKRTNMANLVLTPVHVPVIQNNQILLKGKQQWKKVGIRYAICVNDARNCCH